VFVPGYFGVLWGSLLLVFSYVLGAGFGYCGAFLHVRVVHFLVFFVCLLKYRIHICG